MFRLQHPVKDSNLQLVSLTGPDDNVDIDVLAKLGERYRHVEWALLYVPGKEGQPRNPTRAWRERFFAAKVQGSVAVHLCGAQAFQEVLAGTLPPDILQANRLQLNVNARRREFSDEEVVDIYRAALKLGPSLILQYHEGTASAIHAWLPTVVSEDMQRVHVLLDGSKGRGVRPASWTVPAGLEGVFLGFAGGLNAENALEVAQELGQLGRPYWIDMESGLRTGNEFDIVKAYAVLASCLGGPRPYYFHDDGALRAMDAIAHQELASSAYVNPMQAEPEKAFAKDSAALKAFMDLVTYPVPLLEDVDLAQVEALRGLSSLERGHIIKHLCLAGEGSVSWRN